MGDKAWRIVAAAFREGGLGQGGGGDGGDGGEGAADPHDEHARISGHIRSNVIGYVALFIALGGTAWGVANVGANDIEDNAVRGRHIKPGEVTNNDIDTAPSKAAINDNSMPAWPMRPGHRFSFKYWMSSISYCLSRI